MDQTLGEEKVGIWGEDVGLRSCKKGGEVERPQGFTLALRIPWRSLQTPAFPWSLEVRPSPAPTRFIGSRRAAPYAGSGRGAQSPEPVSFLLSLLRPTAWGWGRWEGSFWAL